MMDKLRDEASSALANLNAGEAAAQDGDEALAHARQAGAAFIENKEKAANICRDASSKVTDLQLVLGELGAHYGLTQGASVDMRSAGRNAHTAFKIASDKATEAHSTVTHILNGEAPVEVGEAVTQSSVAKETAINWEQAAEANLRTFGDAQGKVREIFRLLSYVEEKVNELAHDTPQMGSTPPLEQSPKDIPAAAAFDAAHQAIQERTLDWFK